jgi:hypothetical protein
VTHGSQIILTLIHITADPSGCTAHLQLLREFILFASVDRCLDSSHLARTTVDLTHDDTIAVFLAIRQPRNRLAPMPDSASR